MFTKMGTSYNVRYLVMDNNRILSANENPYTTIKDIKTGKFWNTSAWQTEEYKIPIVSLNNDESYSNDTDPELVCVGVKKTDTGIVYDYNFPTTGTDEYYVTVCTKSGSLYVVLGAQATTHNLNPVVVNHLTVRAEDGSDTLITDLSGNPASGVSVIVSNPETYEIVAQTKTNSFGEWMTVLYPGTYLFTFQRDGLISYKRTFTITS